MNTEDAIDVVARFDFIVASLEKAGVPSEELYRFKQIVSRLPLAKAAATPDDGIGQPQGVVAEGVLEKLQRGTQGFAPVWKSRWIRILPGELQVFESAGRPDQPDTPYLFCLPLSVQQTRIDPGETEGDKKYDPTFRQKYNVSAGKMRVHQTTLVRLEDTCSWDLSQAGKPPPPAACVSSSFFPCAFVPITCSKSSCCSSVCLPSGNDALCKRLGREAILTVSSTTAVGGTLRCVTLATKDNFAMEKWTSFLEKVA